MLRQGKALELQPVHVIKRGCLTLVRGEVDAEPYEVADGTTQQKHLCSPTSPPSERLGAASHSCWLQCCFPNHDD